MAILTTAMLHETEPVKLPPVEAGALAFLFLLEMNDMQRWREVQCEESAAG